MKKCLIFDFNNLAIRCFFVRDVGAKSSSPDFQFWKYLVVESIYKSLSRNGGECSEVILAVDDSKSWRKLYWERYKESRKGMRDKSGVDWQTFHKEMDDFIVEIKEHLPFKVLKIKNAEGDDIIAVLCLERRNNYIIISTDEDFLQLTSNDVKLYNPLKMKFVESVDPKMFVIEKCLLGQSKDDIFNIRTSLNHPLGTKKPPFGETMLAKVMDYGYKKWLKDNKLEERFEINKVLMDFSKIPKTIRSRVLSVYDSYALPDPAGMYDFFRKNKMKSYLENFHNVEEKLMGLY